MVTLDAAQVHVFDRVERTAVVRLVPAEAVGCSLAEDVVAGEDVPPFANSAVDGYAVLAADLEGDGPTELDVVAEVAAGAATDHVLQSGEAVRIMTGAPMPTGADCVVMVEDSERLDNGDRVRLTASPRPGQAVRGVGDDITIGTTVFAAQTVVRAAVVGVLRSVNAGQVAVFAKAKVAVLSTGDELIDNGLPLGPGQIRDSNRNMLVAAVDECGAQAIDYGVVRDDEAELERVLREAAENSDAIVTSGGVSMGDYDVVKAVLSRIAEMTWMQIAIKPAKPFAFGLLTTSAGRQIPVFGLPGNPVSSLVSFELLARPALRKMMGHAQPWMRPTVRALADTDLRRQPDGKIHFQRVHGSFADDGRLHVSARGPQGSHQLAATALSNAIAVVPDGDTVLAGSDVDVMILAL